MEIFRQLYAMITKLWSSKVEKLCVKKVPFHTYIVEDNFLAFNKMLNVVSTYRQIIY